MPLLFLPTFTTIRETIMVAMQMGLLFVVEFGAISLGLCCHGPFWYVFLLDLRTKCEVQFHRMVVLRIAVSLRHVGPWG